MDDHRHHQRNYRTRRSSSGSNSANYNNKARKQTTLMKSYKDYSSSASNADCSGSNASSSFRSWESSECGTDNELEGSTKTAHSDILVKIESLLLSVDDKLCDSEFPTSKRKTFFNHLYSWMKDYIKRKQGEIRVKRKIGNKLWELHFNAWVAYGVNFPEKKNSVCLETHGKLNNWVKEQRRKFMNGTLMEECFRQLRNEGFDFAPRKTIQMM
jgi:hypothetical protein